MSNRSEIKSLKRCVALLQDEIAQLERADGLVANVAPSAKDLADAIYRHVGRDFQHLEPMAALSAWADSIRQDTINICIDACKAKHANGNHKCDTRDDCVSAILTATE